MNSDWEINSDFDHLKRWVPVAPGSKLAANSRAHNGIKLPPIMTWKRRPLPSRQQHPANGVCVISYICINCYLIRSWVIGVANKLLSSEKAVGYQLIAITINVLLNVTRARPHVMRNHRIFLIYYNQLI